MQQERTDIGETFRQHARRVIPWTAQNTKLKKEPRNVMRANITRIV